jgi:hypothetical protein
MQRLRYFPALNVNKPLHFDAFYLVSEAKRQRHAKNQGGGERLRCFRLCQFGAEVYLCSIQGG